MTATGTMADPKGIAEPAVTTRVRRSQLRRRPRQVWLVIPYFVLIAWALTSLYPYIWMLGSGLKTQEDFFGAGVSPLPVGSWQWSNFAQVWEDGFARYFLNTVLVALGTIAIVATVTSMLAYALARLRFPGRGAILGLLGLLLFLPPTYNYIPIVSLVSYLGLANNLVGLILVLAAYSIPLSTLLYFASFQGLPKGLEDAAAVDGLSPIGTYLRIAMPLSGPITVTVCLLTVVSTWNNVVIPLVLTLGAPDLRTLAVGLFAYNGAHIAQYTLICAGASMSILPILGIFLFLQRYFVAGITGAIK